MFACISDCCVYCVSLSCPIRASYCLSLSLSSEMKSNSWSGPSERVRGRRIAWGGFASRSSRIWSRHSLSAGSTCPERKASPQCFVQSPTLHRNHPKYHFLRGSKTTEHKVHWNSHSSIPLSFEAHITQLFSLLLKLHSVLRCLTHRQTKSLLGVSPSSN